MAMAPLPPSGESQWDLKSLVHNPKHPPIGSQLEVMGIHSLSLLALGHVEVITMAAHT